MAKGRDFTKRGCNTPRNGLREMFYARLGIEHVPDGGFSVASARLLISTETRLVSGSPSFGLIRHLLTAIMRLCQHLCCNRWYFSHRSHHFSLTLHHFPLHGRYLRLIPSLRTHKNHQRISEARERVCRLVDPLAVVGDTIQIARNAWSSRWQNMG